MHNVLGKTVRTLFEGVVDANQPQFVRVDAGNLTSGTYIVRLIGESGAMSQTIVLTK
jgi:hypothetical protein